MLWSQFFIPTSKETPADAVVPSHQLLLRAGLVRQVAAGSYAYLPLGYRVLRKIEEIVRQEMNAAGAIELHLPAMQPLAWWEETGRAPIMGDVLLKIAGKGWQTGIVLGPTHEEVITEIARAYINSYKQLPINLYQIQTKFRGEERPKSGVLRTREFLMKDAYSFHADKASLDEGYQKMYDAYCRIYGRCGLPYLIVEAESGPIGGDASHEFMVLTDAGEDVVAISEDRTYAANIERAARTVPPLPADPPASGVAALESIETPNCPGIDDVCAFLKIKPSQMIKTLVYMSSDMAPEEKARILGELSKLARQSGPRATSAHAGIFEELDVLIVCVRGDHEVNENKLRRIARSLGLGDIWLADQTIAEWAGFQIGYVGPHCNPADFVSTRTIIDPDARAVSGAVTGANQHGFHVRNFCWTRELPADVLEKAIVADVRNVVEGDLAPNGTARLTFGKAIEIGHVFKLGTKYSAAMGATYLDESSQPHPLIMGCYGIGLNRIMAAAIEANHDADGIRWPMTIAPFHVLIAALDVREEQVMSVARQIHDALEARGVEVLLDDRDQRPGPKFKDADLIGIPVRINVGMKGLKEGTVELKQRSGKDVEKLAPEAAIARAAEVVESAMKSIGR